MNKFESFDAIITTDNGTRQNATFSLIGKTNMFICKQENGMVKPISSQELLFLLGDKKLDFPTHVEKEKFVNMMDVAISSSLWLNRTKDRVLLIGGIVIGSAAAIFAMTRVLTTIVKAQNK